ncbi:hypothetical protein TNIN_205481, partial [Trichonephila inaurata madagascariensis]
MNLTDLNAVIPPYIHSISTITLSSIAEHTVLSFQLIVDQDKHGKQLIKAITTGLGVSNLFMQKLEEVSPKLAMFYGDRV